MPGGIGEKVKQVLKKEIAPAVEEAVAELADEVMAGEAGLPPGTAVGKGTGRSHKIPWTMDAIRAVYPDVTFTPEQTMPATFNGIRVQLVSGVEITCPSCFKGLYDAHRTAVRKGSSGNIPTPYGVVAVSPGAGALPPEPEPTPPG